mmetsp:Transcript_24523/g.35911  ORF Transcript_24523/g.35911 Transcript_24523/m.35911 type:complete len:498 (+) Transcript_24523:88-1581(+)
MMVRNQLHSHIQHQQWDDARAILQSSDGIEKTQERDVNNDSLALHYAIDYSAPDSFILDLLDIYEDAVWIANSWRQLPLHYAVIQGASPFVVETLILRYPKALDKKDQWGGTPRDRISSRAVVGVKELVNKPTSYWIDRAHNAHNEKRVIDGKALFHAQAKLETKVVNLDFDLAALKTTLYDFALNLDDLEAKIGVYDKTKNKACQEIGKRLTLSEDILVEAETRIEMFLDEIEHIKKDQHATAEDLFVCKDEISKLQTDLSCTSTKTNFSPLLFIILCLFCCIQLLRSKKKGIKINTDVDIANSKTFTSGISNQDLELRLRLVEENLAQSKKREDILIAANEKLERTTYKLSQLTHEAEMNATSSQFPKLQPESINHIPKLCDSFDTSDYMRIKAFIALQKRIATIEQHMDASMKYDDAQNYNIEELMERINEIEHNQHISDNRHSNIEDRVSIIGAKITSATSDLIDIKSDWASKEKAIEKGTAIAMARLLKTNV